jgi:hypothetical protein
LFLLVFLGGPLCVLAQEEEPTFPLENFYVKRKKNARAIFKNFRFGLSTGYGKTYFSHVLPDSFAIYQVKGKAPQIYETASGPSVRYSNWVNKAIMDSSAVAPGSFLVASDTSKLGFKGRAFNIPLKATIHYEFNRYRIGGGYSYEYMNLGNFYPTAFSDKVGSFKPSSPGGFMNKYFGSLGVSFYRLDNYLFIADINIGGFKPGKNFDKSLIKKGIYFNLGVTAERELSEYLRLFVRPSYDIKSYTLNLPGGGNIKHTMNAFYVNVGITYTIPELPRCFHKDCKIQINHAHGNKEYRSRVHPIFKKQNPGYGENNPMIKYKGRNKKKMNPY